jgi:two-component system, chemotaxis family, CheB/CheR fusion protein
MTDSDAPLGNENGRRHPPIVAIGASAGGLRALQDFFSAIPDDTGATFVVVVHLDPEHRSELPRILSGCTRMPVIQVTKREKLEPDHVYVIPPDRRLQLVDHEISAMEFEEPRGKRSPIDLFFRSVAERLGDGFAVILSGAGSDGAIGVRAVKEAGGIILVQDPSEAEYASMPRSAITTGVADFVFPVRELVTRLVDQIGLRKTKWLEETREIDEDLLRRILAHLRVRTGHDFTKYKRSTVFRRIARRMQVTRADELKDYYEVLRDRAEEAQALLGDLLISVTTFFRDADSFEVLQKAVMPELFKGDDPVRVWVPGCATGEEAYSIAIMLLEETARHELRPSIQVFGSDLDAKALSIAREGRYPASIEADVNDERLRRFFTREGDAFRVRQELRDIMLFAVHDLLKDPPFSHVDLISCRNVLIYLDRELQEQVCGTFYYALNPAGFLMLGASESADNPSGLFRTLDRNARVYQSTAVPGDKPRLLPSLLGPVRLREQVVQVARGLSPTAALSEAAIHRRAIEKVAPPSVLVDETHRVLHMSDNAGRFVQPSGGPLSGDIVDLVRQELRFELRSALNRLFEQGQSTLSLPILVRFNGAPHRVHLHVKSADEGDVLRPRNAVVMFVEGEAVTDEIVTSDHEITNETVRRLTQELELTQVRLRTVREESDAANEELRAANEELQSINEEYRSTSEELETSKEELQSINEELQTVNSELKLKLETISRAHSDLQNLMAATDFGTLFLDSSLRIKRFTDRVTQLFSITPTDEGRPITDFAHQLEYEDLTRDARAVLANLAPVQREIHSRNGRWYDIRMRPYRTVDNKIDGVVITFVDVTDRRHVDEALRENERQLQQLKRLIDLSRDPILVWDFDGGIREWNRGCEELYGYSREQALGKLKERLLHTAVPGSSFADLKKELLSQGTWNGKLRHRTKDGRPLTVEARLDLEVVDGQRLVLESMHDITERETLQDRQQLLLGELTHRVKNTLAVVQSIARQTLRNSPSSEEFMERFEGRLTAMANAHGLLVQSNWLEADLAELARAQLAAHTGGNADRVRIEGPEVALKADLATPFGLVLHELGSNAAKHGSWSRRGGRVNLSWSVQTGNQHRQLTVVWQEAGGPKVRSPTQRGFGAGLIENGIPGATVRREFNGDGLVCTIELPLPEEDDGVEHR